MNVVGNSNCHNSGYYCTDFDVVVVADVVVVVAAVVAAVAVVDVVDVVAASDELEQDLSD